jgi:hypothetical protein
MSELPEEIDLELKARLVDSDRDPINRTILAVYYVEHGDLKTKVDIEITEEMMSFPDATEKLRQIIASQCQRDLLTATITLAYVQDVLNGARGDHHACLRAGRAEWRASYVGRGAVRRACWNRRRRGQDVAWIGSH